VARSGFPRFGLALFSLVWVGTFFLGLGWHGFPVLVGMIFYDEAVVVSGSTFTITTSS